MFNTSTAIAISAILTLLQAHPPKYFGGIFLEVTYDIYHDKLTSKAVLWLWELKDIGIFGMEQQNLLLHIKG